MCEVQDSVFSSLADVQQIGVFPIIPEDELRSRPPIGRLLYEGDEMCELGEVGGGDVGYPLPGLPPPFCLPPQNTPSRPGLGLIQLPFPFMRSYIS